MTRLASPVRTAPPSQALWAEYAHSGRSEAARNALMEHYLPLVRSAAIRLSTKSGRRAQPADLDDLLQYGAFGLKDAIRGFDPSRGFKFETYALQRIRGAMLDGLKSANWVPRDIRQRVAKYSAARTQLESAHGPGPDPQTLSAHLAIDTHALHDLEQHAARTSMASLHVLEDTAGADEESADPATLIPDHREESPAHQIQRKDVRNIFFRELTRSERHLLMLYYYEEFTMRQIGEVLGISGTRVSQLHTDIMQRLRERLSSRMTNDAGFAQPPLEI